MVNKAASAARAATGLGLRGNDSAVRSAVQGITAKLAGLFPQVQSPRQRTAVRLIGAAAATEAVATGSAPGQAAQQVAPGQAGGSEQEAVGGRQQAEQESEGHAGQHVAQQLASVSDSESDSPLAKRQRLLLPD